LRRRSIPFIIFGIFLLLGGEAHPVSFDIRPVRIFFDADTRVERLNIANKGEDDLSLQVRIYRWLQNDAGEDIYEETGDIVAFPRMLRIKKGEERAVRVGTDIRPESKERTYRIYIEEMPVPGRRPEGAAVRVLMRAGVPVFVAPLKARPSGKIESVSVRDGEIRVSLKNDGNLHFIINSLTIKGANVKGEEIFKKELAGWYLLSGVSRIYEASIPRDLCADTAWLEIEVKTDRFTLGGRLDVERAMCPGGVR
jgi:fimbrial chaperone protein